MDKSTPFTHPPDTERRVSIDQIRKTFEAGFRAGWLLSGKRIGGEYYNRMMMNAWKEFCGVNS